MFRSVFGAAVAAFGLATASAAATITLDPIESTWVAVKPPTAAYVATQDGLESTILWGTPRRQPLRSGYVFSGNPGADITLGEEFDVGTFTHLNRIIAVGTSITQATLSVDIGLNIGGFNYELRQLFDFNHWETRNQNRICADNFANGVGANVNGCADRVTIEDNVGLQDRITVDGLTYRLEITGFMVGSELFDEFWTVERQANSAVIRGRIVAEPVTPPPSPVPLPAGAVLLGGALAGLALMRRRA